MEAELHGYRFLKVGDKLLRRPKQETLHELFLFLLKDTLGAPWHEKEAARPDAERHVVERWFEAWEVLRGGEVEAVDTRTEGEGRKSAAATGDLQSLLALAYDVYTLRDSLSLPLRIVSRLRDREQFQGARYEIAVASALVRAGYTIEWITDTDRKLPEFVARNAGLGTAVAVEAKSRHRPGVLGRPGEAPDPDAVTVDVLALVRGALEKKTDGRPFVICIDLNLPTDTNQAFLDRVKTLSDEALVDFASSSAENPDPFSAIVFTNYSWHWDGAKVAGNPMNFLAIPTYPEVPLSPEDIDLLRETLLEYGDIPTDGER